VLLDQHTRCNGISKRTRRSPQFRASNEIIPVCSLVRSSTTAAASAAAAVATATATTAASTTATTATTKAPTTHLVLVVAVTRRLTRCARALHLLRVIIRTLALRRSVVVGAFALHICWRRR
jgi:hypothetical protein